MLVGIRSWRWPDFPIAIGTLSEIYLVLPPVLVLIGAVSITVTTALFALELVRMVVGGSMSLKFDGMAKVFEMEFNRS
ncbi:hypothetical protein CK500_14580 [Halorubrum salipaludis]|uniref:Uncharacterized protein n=1 Tax=Halorubrum salipaludis TaxID=2032630 RepID=A0A2A2F978_9EURY|nr:hypothetical protein CK500_14580 [Halorubrum salipaludis]